MASAARTHVCTPAQPPPSILWPACSSDHVTKLAHHGLPGPTPADARYSSTFSPVLVPSSFTPAASSFLATSSADAPRLLEPPAVAVAASATTAGAPAAGAIALAGPAGGRMNESSSPCLGAAAFAASSAVTALKESESPALAFGCATAAAAAAGWPGAGTAAAAAAGGAVAALPRRSLASPSLSW